MLHVSQWVGKSILQCLYDNPLHVTKEQKQFLQNYFNVSSAKIYGHKLKVHVLAKKVSVN